MQVAGAGDQYSGDCEQLRVVTGLVTETPRQLLFLLHFLINLCSIGECTTINYLTDFKLLNGSISKTNILVNILVMTNY